VPPESVVVGVPGEIVKRSKPRLVTARADLDHGALPDVIGDSLVALMARVEQLEIHLSNGHGLKSAPYMPDHGVWVGEDFSI
jgi:serine O-acetyltransferase